LCIPLFSLPQFLYHVIMIVLPNLFSYICFPFFKFSSMCKMLWGFFILMLRCNNSSKESWSFLFLYCYSYKQKQNTIFKQPTGNRYISKAMTVKYDTLSIEMISTVTKMTMMSSREDEEKMKRKSFIVDQQSLWKVFW
jgi:hypothetical protein